MTAEMNRDLTVKGKMKINRNIPTEYLLSNIIDKEFQAVLLPLRILQSFFLIFKFSIINNFITPDSNRSFYIKSGLGLILALSIHYNRFIYYREYYGDSAKENLSFLLYFDYCLFSLVTIMIYIDSALKRNKIVELVITVQKALNSFKIDKKAFYLKHRIQNWLTFLSLIWVYIVYWWFSRQDLRFYSLFMNFIFMLSMLIFDINIVTVTCIVVMIKNMLLAWTHVMQEYKKDNKTSTGEEMKNNEMPERAMFNAYADIIKSYRLCNKVYEFTFTFCAFQTFTYILLSLQSVIELCKGPKETSSPQIIMLLGVSTVWNVKNLIVIGTLNIACENFYSSVKLAESSCAQILNDDGVVGMRRTCKNVLRLNGAVMKKLSAFGAFELDAALPLRLLSGLVTYVVVLLQFAFL